MDEGELAALQAALLRVLQQAQTVGEARALLAREPLAEPAQRWLAEADPRALETAMLLVRRWLR